MTIAHTVQVTSATQGTGFLNQIVVRAYKDGAESTYYEDMLGEISVDPGHEAVKSVAIKEVSSRETDRDC